jgi:hypothetical protein
MRILARRVGPGPEAQVLCFVKGIGYFRGQGPVCNKSLPGVRKGVPVSFETGGPNLETRISNR